MAARHRRRGLGLLLVLVAVGAAVAIAVSADDPATTPEPASAPTSVPEAVEYANPVVEGSTRNPSILRAADGTYYAYVDGFDLGVPFHVMAYASPDLATWTPVGDVLATAGAWSDPSSGRRFSTPAVRHLPDNPPDARYVMTVTAPPVDGGPACVGVATASDPGGPFVGADEPLLCGARDASPVPGSDQVVYRADQPTSGIYAVTLTPDGTAVAAGAEPTLVLRTEDGILRRGVLERPAVARDADGRAYLFVRTGDVDDGVGWTPCLTAGSEITTCAGRRQLGTWLDGSAEVGAIGGVQVFTDDAGASWIAYHASPAESCTGPACSDPAGLRIDKLCFAHGQPRTNGPSTGPQPTQRPSDCSADVPGVPLAVTAVTDEVRVSQPPEVTFRDGGSTVPLGGRLLWLFSDTYIDPARTAPGEPCRDRGGSRSNTAGLGLPHPLAGDRGYASPLATGGDEGRCAEHYIPLTADELSFNRARTDVGQWVVLWENGGIPLDDGSALVFFVTSIQDRDADAEGPDPGCGYCYAPQRQGVVRVTADQTVADRASTAVACAPTCLFEADDSWSGRPFLADGFVYMYSDTPESSAVRLGRVPVAAVLDRSAWTFRTAEGTWSPVIAEAAAIAGLGTRPPRVAYNGHLDRFVDIFPTGGDGVAIQTAPEPWGPWSEPTPIYDWAAVECPGVDAYGPIAAPALDDGGGRVVRFAFSRPGRFFGKDPACPGEMRLVTVELA